MFNRSPRAKMSLGITLAALVTFAATTAIAAPIPSAATSAARSETATFAGGCFWSMNAIFERLKGVDQVTAGFSGGNVANPSYERVCTGTTGHAETVQITFDPAVISYRDLLDVFFAFVDPTTLNRQGADAGTQYRSAIFFHTPAQRAAAIEAIATLEKQHAFKSPIVTQVVPYRQFYPAEDYHQAYYDKNSNQPYCQFVIAPKLSKLRKHYAEKLKAAS